MLAFKGNNSDVNNFAERMKSRPIPGMPPLNLKRVVHATQSIEVIKTLPLISGPGWKWKSRYTGVVENSKLCVVTMTLA